LKFGDVVMAAASAMVIFVLVGVPLHLALVSPLGYYWGDIVGMIIAILISAVIVGYVFAGKIWEEHRMRAVGQIAILAAVLMGFAVIMETAALPHWGAWMKARYEADNPGVNVAETDWYYIEGIVLGLEVFIDVVLVLLLGFVGVFVGSMFKKTVKS
jgi:hypothetical protein